MLQWMGGSRRKVTTSRKSTQQRQKQYFEQKRRQHHQGQISGLESYADGVNISEQQNKEHRSLDILSLLNLSKFAQEHKPVCSSGREDAEVNASRVKVDITRDLTKVPAKMVAPSNYVEFNKARVDSCFEVEIPSPKKVALSAPDDHNKSLNEANPNPKPDNCTTEFSVLDFVGDDALNDHVEGSPVHEAHVAFSVEGLGKMGMETPVHSPNQPGRTFVYDCSSPLNPARGPKSFNSHKHMDDFEMEMDAMMQDINLPLHSSGLKFSNDSMDSFRNSMPKISTHDGDSDNLDSNYGCRRIFDNVESYRKDTWDGLGKMRMEVHSPNQPGRTFVYDCSSPLNTARGPQSFNSHKHLAEFEMEMDAMMQDINMPLHSSGLKFSNDSMDSFRNSMPKISTHDGYSDSLGSKYRCRRIFDNVENYRKDTKDGGPCFPDDNSFNDWEHDLSWNNWRSPMNCGLVDNLGRGKYKISDFPPEGPFSPIRSAADITDKFDILELPSYSKHRTPENDHDFMGFSGVRHHRVGRNFDFGAVSGPPDWSCLVTENEKDRLSEESCSSSAVRVNAMDSSLSKSTRNMSKRRHDNAYPGSEYNANTCTGKTRDKNRHVVQPENISQGSGKSTKMPDSSKLKPSCYSSSPFQEKLTSTANWFTDERYRSVDRNSGCSSLHEKLETNFQSAGSKFFVGDPFSASPVPELHRDPRSPKHCKPIASSPSGSFISQKFEAELRYSCGKMLSPNSSEQESVSKDEKIKAESVPREKSKLVGENSTVNDRFFTEAKDEAPALGASIRSTYFPDHAEKAFSSLKTPDRSGGLMDEKEDHHGYQIPLPCQNMNKEIEDAEPLERMKESKQQSDFMDSSCQVMMLQSYVQFLCVQKVLNEAGANKT